MREGGHGSTINVNKRGGGHGSLHTDNMTGRRGTCQFQHFRKLFPPHTCSTPGSCPSGSWVWGSSSTGSPGEAPGEGARKLSGDSQEAEAASSLARRGCVTHLPVGDYVDVLLLDHLVEELPECSPVLLLLEPEGVEVETEGGPVGVVVTPGETAFR